MNIEELTQISYKIGGWLTEGQGQALYRLAKNCSGKGVIVEIGSWKGRSTVWLGYGSKEGNHVKVYAVDPHTGSSEHRLFGRVWTFDDFMENIKWNHLEDVVIPLVTNSESAVHLIAEPVEMIFIDGSHEYEDVKNDFQLWYPKIITGGVLALHDVTTFPGPARIAEEFIQHSDNFTDITIVDSMLVATKVGN